LVFTPHLLPSSTASGPPSPCKGEGYVAAILVKFNFLILLKAQKEKVLLLFLRKLVYREQLGMRGATF